MGTTKHTYKNVERIWNMYPGDTEKCLIEIFKIFKADYGKEKVDLF
jgi:hypothetical protein